MASGDVLLSRLLTTIAISLGDSTAQLRQHRTELEQTRAAGERMGQTTQGVQERAVELRSRIIELNSELTGLRGRLRDLESQSAALGPGAGLAPNIQSTREEMARLGIQIQATQGELRELGRGAEGSGDGFNTGAGAIGRYFTALIAIQSAVQLVEGQARAWGEFDAALVRTEALTTTTHQEIQEMIPTLREMSVETGRSLKELGEGLYNIESSGLKGKAGLDVLKLSAQGASLGMGETKDIARLLTQAINVYGLTAQDSGHLMDALTVAVREGSGEATDYARNTGQVLQIAAALGISFDQVAGSLAVMSLGEQNTARNATALKNVLQELYAIKPNSDAAKALKEIGLTAEQVRDMVANQGLPAALLELKTRAQDSTETLERIFPDIRGFTGILQLTGAQASRYVEIVDQAGHSTGIFGERVGVAGQGIELQTNRMARGFDNLGSSLSEKLSPFILPIVEGLANGLTPRVTEGGAAAEKSAGQYLLLANVLKTLGEGAGKGLSDPKNIPLLGGLITTGATAVENIQQIGDALGGLGNKLDQLGRETVGNETFLSGGVAVTRAQAEERMQAAQEATRQYQEMLRTNAEQEAQVATDAIASEGDRIEAAYGASFDFNRQQALIGTNGQKLLKAIDEFITKPFGAGKQEALEASASFQVAMEEAWRKALDPSIAESQISRLNTVLAQIRSAETEEGKNAARAVLNGLLVEFGEGDESRRVQAITDRNAASRRAENQRVAREQAQQAKEARDAMITGLTGDLEARRQEVQAAYGRVADSAITGFVSALSGAKSGNTTEPILRAQAALAEQLKTAGVTGWQEAAQRVGEAYLAALAGTMSGAGAAQILVEALSEIPKLNPETFAVGLDRQAFLSLGGNAGRSLAEGIANGFKDGGQKSITEVQRGAIAMVRETEKITDPDLAAQRSADFWRQLNITIADGSQAALDAFEDFAAKWRRQIDVDIAQQQYVQKVRQGAEENVRTIIQANLEANRQIDELTRGVGEERGTQGLETFRQHMREALGEETDLFRNVSRSIDEQQEALAGGAGFRAAREGFQRLMDDRLTAFREEQYVEQTAFSDAEEQKRREMAHTRAEEDAGRSHGREDAQLALSQQRENQDVSRRQQREEAEAQRQLNKELADAQARGASPQDIAGIRGKYAENVADRERQRQFDSQDRQLQRQRATEDLALRRSQEVADRQFALAREEQDVQITREARTRQHEFELTQARAQQREQRAIAETTREFEDQQSDMRLGHQARNIEAERGKRIFEANQTFADLLKAETLHRDNVQTQAYDPAWKRMKDSYDDIFYNPAQQEMDDLISSALRNNGSHDPSDLASVASSTNAQQASSAADQNARNDGPLEVVLPDEQIDDLAAAAASRPIEMSGEDVESVQSKIRRNKNLARSLS